MRREVAELVRYRLEQAQTALDDGRFLIDGGRPPLSILNRSYYAMFYTALALLQTIMKVPSKHAGVLSVFDKEFVATGIFPKELSSDFHRAFDLRQKSDYKVVAPMTRETTVEIWRKASHFVEIVRQYLQERGLTE